MSQPIKGSKEVDDGTLQKNQKVCKYVIDNINQLSQAVLVGLITLFDETKIHLNRALDWKLKQGQGGKYVARIKEQIDELASRITNLETNIGGEMQKGETTPEEN
jgi:hypothetical protein